MKSAPQLLAAAALSFWLTSPLAAAIATSWVSVASGDGSIGPVYPADALANDPALHSMWTVDLLVHYDTSDWALAGLRATLPSGSSFYKHPLGGNTRPPDPLITANPALAFTTYVTSPASTGTSDPTNVLGGFPEGDPLSLGDATSALPGVFSVSWGDLVSSPPGQYRIARWTFPLGPFPDILLTQPHPSFTQLTDGEFTLIIPPAPAEPAVLPPLVLAAFVLARRVRCAQRSARCDPNELGPELAPEV